MTQAIQTECSDILKDVADNSTFIVTQDYADVLYPLIAIDRADSNLEVRIVSTAKEVLAILEEEDDYNEDEYEEEYDSEIIFMFSQDNEELKGFDIISLDALDPEELDFEE